MSLVSFHRFLIITSSVFCLGFAWWAFDAAASGAAGGSVVLGAVFTLLGIALILYLRRLARFLGYQDAASLPR